MLRAVAGAMCIALPALLPVVHLNDARQQRVLTVQHPVAIVGSRAGRLQAVLSLAADERGAPLTQKMHCPSSCNAEAVEHHLYGSNHQHRQEDQAQQLVAQASQHPRPYQCSNQDT